MLYLYLFTVQSEENVPTLLVSLRQLIVTYGKQFIYRTRITRISSAKIR